MINAKVPKSKRHIIAQKAIKTATKLDGLISVKTDGVTKLRVEHWSGTAPGFAKRLRKWGEAGVVKAKIKPTLKLQERGITCMLVGCATWQNVKPQHKKSACHKGRAMAEQTTL